MRRDWRRGWRAAQGDDRDFGHASSDASAGHLDKGQHRVGSWMWVLWRPTRDACVRWIESKTMTKMCPVASGHKGHWRELPHGPGWRWAETEHEYGREEVGKQTRVQSTCYDIWLKGRRKRRWEWREYRAKRRLFSFECFRGEISVCTTRCCAPVGREGTPGWETGMQVGAGESTGPTRADTGILAVDLAANANGFVGFKVERAPAGDSVISVQWKSMVPAKGLGGKATGECWVGTPWSIETSSEPP